MSLGRQGGAIIEMGNVRMPGEVFISYKREQRSEARKLARALACHGVTVWYDRSLDAGEDFERRLQRQMEAARIVVVLWCPLSVESQSYVYRVEAPYAASVGKLLGVQIKGCTIPDPYKKLHTISLADWDRLPDSQHDGFLALVNAIDRRLERRLVLNELEARRVRDGLAQQKRPGSRVAFRDDEALPSPFMLAIPEGQFLMGSPLGEPERERPPMEPGAELQTSHARIFFEHPFAVSRTPVTRREFKVFVEATSLETSRGALVCRNDRIYFDPRGSWNSPGIPQADDHPVTCVTWYEAREYARWLSEITGARYRLLSEAEWEYAARAGETRPFASGPVIEPEMANYDWRLSYAAGPRRWSYRRSTSSVSKHEPHANHWGLLDMHGNVAEWCEDSWHPQRVDAPQDGRAIANHRTVGAGDDLRVTRGGSWRDGPRALRAAARSFAPALQRADNIGFRIARDLSPVV